ncbi:MAG: DUF1858 domain-containing protein [Ezakiella sp.]|nr:DUF1858 domain-containing protein [Ezakiella sp.]MDD7471585.1 DUF1858 domain-containing protein [Bacillota bacterium]MDY3922821.1 DUF1858 domain-containing protein [Ezakiella sp.]
MADVQINKDMYLGELLEAKPESAYLLMSYGMGCIGCAASQMETIEEACMVHGINLDRLLSDLNRL